MKKCCNNPIKYEITYDAGTDSSEWSLCESHYNSDPVFQKHIKTIKEIKE